MRNVDKSVVADFGDEWSAYDQSGLTADEHRGMFEAYFHIFPWQQLPERAQGMDVGCGSGRWARLVAPRVGKLHCVDPSAKALEVARRNLEGQQNCELHLASANDIPLPDGSLDFGYSLGVLHHVPDTEGALLNCIRKLRPGAPFLLYLYYALDNRPWWFRAVWRTSDGFRRLIAALPFAIKLPVTRLIALTVYWPLARTAKLCEKLGIGARNIPLSDYRNSSFYTMKTDALDRFGTRLEKRYSRRRIQQMMEQGGLTDIRFSETAPFWCAVGLRVESSK
jgi:ubiquinone/menaquinone biosynthesis C-methylase UbiE